MQVDFTWTDRADKLGPPIVNPFRSYFEDRATNNAPRNFKTFAPIVGHSNNIENRPSAPFEAPNGTPMDIRKRVAASNDPAREPWRYAPSM